MRGRDTPRTYPTTMLLAAADLFRMHGPAKVVPMASSRPFFVGIAGGTGSGKTTIAQKLEGNLPPNAAVLINHDSYYKDRSGMPAAERDLLNFDHPDALDNALLIQHLDELAQGRPVEAPIYDFVNHVRGAATRRVEPTHVVIVEGILIFADPEIRRRF